VTLRRPGRSLIRLNPWRRKAAINHRDERGESLIGTELSNADLSAACLRGAKLRGAKLAGAKLDGADLTDAQISEPLWSANGRT
jgi:uncharacterized protein YjbI with pentapeptide repeats